MLGIQIAHMRLVVEGQRQAQPQKTGAGDAQTSAITDMGQLVYAARMMERKAGKKRGG